MACLITGTLMLLSSTIWVLFSQNALWGVLGLVTGIWFFVKGRDKLIEQMVFDIFNK